MYIEYCIVKRQKDSEWEEALYVGKTDNCHESVILDKNYKPIDEVWNYKSRTSVISMNVPITIGSSIFK